MISCNYFIRKKLEEVIDIFSKTKKFSETSSSEIEELGNLIVQLIDSLTKGIDYHRIEDNRVAHIEKARIICRLIKYFVYLNKDELPEIYCCKMRKEVVLMERELKVYLDMGLAQLVVN